VTTTRKGPADAARATKDTTEQVADSAPMRLLGRSGFVAYGIVFLVLAWLALQIAIGGGGEEASKTGALQQVAGSPGGKALLWFIAVGAAALAIRGLVEAAWGHTRYDGSKRTLKRVGSLVEAGLLAALALSAVKIVTGRKSGGSATASTTSSLLDSTGGRLLVGAVGLAIVGGAAYVAWRGISKHFLEDLDFSGASAGTRDLATKLGEAGWAGVGVAYALVGAFVVGAAVTHDPKKASGLDGALRRTAGEPYGVVLLVVIAAGLAAYGAFCFFQARLRED
jgi:hypothetical protein